MADRGVYANLSGRHFSGAEATQQSSILRRERIPLSELDARRRAVKRVERAVSMQQAVVAYDSMQRPMKPPGR